MKNRQTLTDHQAAARAALQQRGVWVPGPVYPTVDSAQSAARRVPLARQLTAYLPIGSFEAYGARCEDGGALWVRHVGDGPALEPMPQRMTVRVPTYGSGPGYSGVGIVTVSIVPTCPVCGGPRGFDAVKADPFMRDGETFVRDRWANPCGHQDRYDLVLDEARRTPPAPGGKTPEDAPARKLPALAVPCTRCGAKAGDLCTSHNGARLRLVDVHRPRTEAWHTERVRSVPAAALVLAAANRRDVTHGRQAADLLAAKGFTAEADAVETLLKIQNGHLSAKQTVTFLVERAETARGGEA
ncbi:zinc finger domain-containing protein [Streptomyces variegatus]|uniref:zinc finger domain-containing protein n=1 Tax=Streptomyces variegatus TaxID=284040 RepID=UPI003C3056FD